MAVTGVDPAKRYYITVSKAVYVMPKMIWRPSDQFIQADGQLILDMDAKPENAGAITLGNEVTADEVR